MLRKTFILLMAVVMCFGAAVLIVSRNVTGFQRTRFYSESLHKWMNVDVYLPPHYSQKLKYPVLYLLHGKDGNPNSWMTSYDWWNSIHIDRIATDLIHRRQIRPLIIVSPEIDNGYGINTSQRTYAIGGYNRGRYADYITHDLVHYIDTHYSVDRSRAGRYIGGYSMGGFAALHAAFSNQAEYSKVGVISAALWDGGLPSSLSWIYPTPSDQTSRDPITIAKHTKIHIPVLIIEGTSDPFYSADLTLANELRAQGAHITLHTYPGGHNYAFWRHHATELLLFFAKR
ncbi:MAG: dienelactone hydrolase family protein [Alicyclobacillus sp.]|nr:dienelactone hydrolase family protein [Alicyclobacillus sp.]